MNSPRLALWPLVFALAACGRRPVPNPPPPGTLTVRASAGTPIRGLRVDVYALKDKDASPYRVFDFDSHLGSGGPTDEDGKTALLVRPYNGPIAIVASGEESSFIDPSDGATVVTLPTGLVLSTHLADYRGGTSLTVPLTLWTTLADGEALAYLNGRHRLFPERHTLGESLAFADMLFVGHIAPGWDLRSAVPVPLTARQHTLSDDVYAALPDIALSQLARDLSPQAGFNPQNVINTATLMPLLLDDVTADGQFDGLGSGGMPLLTPGNPPLPLGANTLRIQLADALDHFLKGPQNKTTLTHTDVQFAGVMDNIANDRSSIFGSQPPQAFDEQPPEVSFGAMYLGTDNVKHPVLEPDRRSRAAFTLAVDARDTTGVRSLAVSVDGVPVPPDPGSTPTHFVATWHAAVDGPLTFTVTAVDLLGNTGRTDFRMVVDNTPPSITVGQPLAGSWYKPPVPIQAAAVDPSGIASFGSADLPSFVSSGATPGLIDGYWAPGSAQPDGPVTFHLVACDTLTNCTAPQAVAFGFDQTPPNIKVDSEFKSYVDESGMTLNAPGGTPAVPVTNASYSLNGSTRVQLAPGADQATTVINKAATRLSWGPIPPTGSDLEGANSYNIPTVRFKLGYVPGANSPIPLPTYQIDVFSGTALLETRAGSLIASAYQDIENLYFDLPLASDTIPSLRSLPGPNAFLKITIRASDAAGNPAEPGIYWLTFNVLGPPLVLTADLNYDGARDPQSVFPYHISNGSYASLWGSAGQLRILRYLVSNPYPDPIPLSVAIQGVMEADESWNDSTFAFSSSSTLDGFTYQATYSWEASNGTPDYPCGGDAGASASQYPLHTPGDSNQFSCAVLPVPSTQALPLLIAASVPLSAQAFLNPTPFGRETQGAAIWRNFSPGGYWVPAASTSAPGQLALYVVRDRVLHSPPLPTFQSVAGSPGTKIQSWNFDFWSWNGMTQPCIAIFGALCAPYGRYRYATILNQASEQTVNGAINVMTYGLDINGVPYGSPRTILSGPISKGVSH